MPGTVEVLVWSEDHKAKYMNPSVYAHLFGGNYGHTVLKVTIPKDELTEETLKKIEDGGIRITETFIIPSVAIKDAHDNIVRYEAGEKIPAYEIYHSFWPSDEGRALRDRQWDEAMEREGRGVKISKKAERWILKEKFKFNKAQTEGMYTATDRRKIYEKLSSIKILRTLFRLKPEEEQSIKVYSGPQSMITITEKMGHIIDRLKSNSNEKLRKKINELILPIESSHPERFQQATQKLINGNFHHDDLVAIKDELHGQIKFLKKQKETLSAEDKKNLKKLSKNI